MANKKYYTGKSKIQGKGAFAKKSLKPGDLIGKVHTINQPYVDYEFTELGRNHNHSENPNVQNVLIGNERHLVATKPIKKGQELTSNYRLQPDLEQPEDFKKGGWLDKYSPETAQNGIEGTMGGLTDKGFNYNGAWGGQFAMGGSLPGAVGFTYARTNSPAPSEGPYAKKTMPSAQNGAVEDIINSSRESMVDFYGSRPQDLQIPGLEESLEKIKIKGKSPRFMDRFQGGALGYYNPISNVIAYNTDPSLSNVEGGLEQTLKHELGHRAFSKLPKEMKQIVKESMVSPEEVSKNLGVGKGFSNYLTEKSEFYTRRRPLYEAFGLDPSSKISKEQAQQFVDFRNALDSVYTGEMTPGEGYEKFKQAYPEKVEMLDKFRTYPGSEEVLQFMNTIKNEPEAYMRMFNDVTAVPGETVPMAQNGMSYYQHGLDWKPKTISRNGGWLDKYTPEAQNGFDYQMPRAASESTSRSFFDPVTKRMVSTSTTGQKKKDVKASTEDMGKGKKRERDEEKARVAERKSAVAAKDKGKPFTLPSGETKRYEDMTAREKMYVSGKAIEQKGRFNEDGESFIDEYLNPLSFIGSVAGALGTAPLEAEIYDSNLPYVGAVATPLISGALGFDPLGSAMKVPGKVAQSMESGLLSNTYKLNPWRFQPKSTSAYRMIGDEAGLANAMESGYLRPSTKGSDIGKIHTTAHYQMGAPSDTRKYFGRSWGRGYEGPYMAEVPNAASDVRFSQGPGGKGAGADVWTYPENYIPSSEANFYKQDWLRGYKEVPKQEEGGLVKAQNGGRAPIYTSDPRRLKSYQDSLGLYNRSIQQLEQQRRNEQKLLDDYNKTVHWYNTKEKGRLSHSTSKMTPEQKKYNVDKSTGISPTESQVYLAVTDDNAGHQQQAINMFPKPVQQVMYKSQQKPRSGEWKPLKPFTGVIENSKPKSKPEPRLKKKVSQVNKLPMGEPSQEMRITERQFPTINSQVKPRQEKTEFAFTYTPGGGNEQKTIYYPTYDAWREAIDMANAAKPGYNPGMVQTTVSGDRSSAQALLQGTPQFLKGGLVKSKQTKKVNQKPSGSWLDGYK
jgi:hypothetical protein